MFAIDQGSDAFLEKLDVPFDVYEPLFTTLFSSIQYTEWMKTEHSWPLRVVGPPGCGKTTVSALAARRLHDRFDGQNVGVASIFFQRSARESGDEVAREVLRSINSQLADQRTPSVIQRKLIQADEQSHLPVHARDTEFEVLRTRIRQTVASLDQSFLIVDDIDLLPSSVLALVEAELVLLQSPSLGILVTSRTPHSYDPNEPLCDFHETEVSVYWCCKRCYGEGDDFVGEDAEVICYECKTNDKKCRECGLTDMFYEPYKYVRYLMYNLDGFREFVAYELERTHGDLGLESSCEDIPPPSSFGRALNRTKPIEARKIRDDIVQEAKSNVTLAKARLDSRLGAQDIAKVGHLSDRLPDNILALFDAAINHVSNSAHEDRDIGLNAIVAAVLMFNGREFYELEDWLVSLGLVDYDDSEVEEYNMLRILRASGGLLVPDYGVQALVRPYHVLFTTYVAENYNETLFHLRSRVDESIQSRAALHSVSVASS